MIEEICEHVASGRTEPLTTIVHKETGKKHTFCFHCLLSFLHSKGIDATQFVIGYNVYQTTDPDLPKDQWKKLNDKPIPDNNFKQHVSLLERGKTYYSYITAVSALGIESPPSEVTSLTIPLSGEDEIEWPTFLNEVE